ncbi:hypothetical protein L1987_16538 [Smallanthus sonchifolius]|uniref:Uncharacterized protein n=1 Tax=Smallanthus sonchifolius TaxID=185202 RepID=A0ACB9J8L9_9ASTR|nr:hypothetical protein L1987_16538 [Smallanthus sonchifolius]
MGDSVGSLGVSVSFGKYENDALSWEKWSTFSPNKYLEEVGKCSTPGSVAQKKAFFEAHYKKIAAMKAAEAELLLDQEKATHSTSDDHTFQVTSEISAIHGSGELQEDKPLNDESMQVGESQSPMTVNSNAHKPVLVNDESRKLVKQHFPDVLESPITLNSNADKLEEAVLVNNESMKLVKQHFQVDLETEEPPEVRQEIPKEKAQNVPRKINPNKVEKNSIGMKKKPASLIPKSPETPATRLSKPKATSASSLKKASAPSSSKNKNHSVSESRHVAPVSRKAAEKISPARGQLGPTWKSVSSGSLKGVGVDERRLKAGPTSVALKSNERAERRKEFFKNLEEKSNAREAERSQLSLKSKFEKERRASSVELVKCSGLHFKRLIVLVNLTFICGGKDKMVLML